MMNKTLPLAALALAGLLAAAPAALAVDEYNVSTGMTAAGAPLGLHGVDPVAFIETGEATEGDARFAAQHDGVAYYFASEVNADAFAADPERYLPQNGGFCTYGVSVGKKFDGDPAYAALIDGKLYVFLNRQIFELFLEDQGGTIAKAAANWPGIKHSAAKDL